MFGKVWNQHMRQYQNCTIHVPNFYKTIYLLPKVNRDDYDPESYERLMMEKCRELLDR